MYSLRKKNLEKTDFCFTYYHGGQEFYGQDGDQGAPLVYTDPENSKRYLVGVDGWQIRDDKTVFLETTPRIKDFEKWIIRHIPIEHESNDIVKTPIEHDIKMTPEL
ncbi:uncharacterized protein LOC116344408 isoform X2 [Contarinia nasturtii]|uniref:uncharacterized protein LOC116344408 isoform X2 n=1 Tax=Contarinia nasturtii TaxID=265458 RepID=UPI0012D39876|nr:uncharacterized protein LOC116344408 isoform X2 [Contarinia nasturtii]